MAAERIKKLPTYERVRELFHYDPERGQITKNGRIMGWRNGNGYLRIDIDGSKYYVHRVAVLLMTGKWPSHTVDHRDLNKTNNRWENLRCCSKSLNQGNRTKRSDNQSGVKGVHWDASRRKWVAQISKDRYHYFLGRHENIEDATAAHRAKASDLYGEFARV